MYNLALLEMTFYATLASLLLSEYKHEFVPLTMNCPTDIVINLYRSNDQPSSNNPFKHSMESMALCDVKKQLVELKLKQILVQDLYAKMRKYNHKRAIQWAWDEVLVHSVWNGQFKCCEELNPIWFDWNDWLAINSIWMRINIIFFVCFLSAHHERFEAIQVRQNPFTCRWVQAFDTRTCGQSLWNSRSYWLR